MAQEESKNIVILGGGFAGITAIHQLLRHYDELKKAGYKITLVDRNSFHLFTPSLYEVATSEQTQKNICIPFREIFGNKVSYVKGNVTKIDPANHLVLLDNQQLPYDYLLVALGSETSYYHIEGLAENSVPLKSIQDAIKIKDTIKSLCCKEGQCNKKVQVVIGGGGFSGTELAAELLTYKTKLAKQHHLAPDCLEVTIIQGSDRLLKELDPHVSTIAENRVKGPLVHFAFGGHVNKVSKDTVFTDDGKSYPFDILIWTGGVKANHLAQESGLPVNKHGCIEVNGCLQSDTHIFSAGDVAGYLNFKTNKLVPAVAQIAEEQGKAAGENIYRSIVQKELLPYHFRHWGYVVPLKGRFAAAELMGWMHFDGFLGWIVQQVVLGRYLFGILPTTKALRRWNRYEQALDDRY